MATRLFPERVRRGTYALYGFFRVADEVVDDPDGDPPDRQRRELARVRAGALGERDTGDPVLSAFRAAADEHGIADREVELFLDAMEMDITVDRYDTHEDLSTYLRGSSVAVAYMMLDVMGADDRKRARPHAGALGEAFQLTNFLRDVREDVLEYDRIYLPLATLEQFDVDPVEVESLSFSKRFARAMKYELRRTEQLYREGVAGIEYLPRDCQFPVLLAAVLYAEHHRLIRRRDYDVLSARPTLNHPRRLAVAARTWLYWKHSGDPVATFAAVSAVPTIDEGTNAERTEDERETDDATAARTPPVVTDGSMPDPAAVDVDEQILADRKSGDETTCRSIRRRLGDLLP